LDPAFFRGEGSDRCDDRCGDCGTRKGARGSRGDAGRPNGGPRSACGTGWGHAGRAWSGAVQ